MAVTDDMLEIDQSQLAAFHSLLMSPGLNRNLQTKAQIISTHIDCFKLKWKRC